MNLQGKTKGSKPVNKQALYSAASAHAVKAIRRLAELVESKNEPVAVSASKALLAKCLPDLKASEIYGKDGDKLEGLILIQTDKAVKVAD